MTGFGVSCFFFFPAPAAAAVAVTVAVVSVCVCCGDCGRGCGCGCCDIVARGLGGGLVRWWDWWCVRVVRVVRACLGDGVGVVGVEDGEWDGEEKQERPGGEKGKWKMRRVEWSKRSGGGFLALNKCACNHTR